MNGGRRGHGLAHDRWHVDDDTVHTHTMASDEAADRRQGWDFVERTLSEAGSPVRDHPQLHAAAVADRGARDNSH